MNNAKLIAATEPYINNGDGIPMTTDEFIAYVARVSNPSNQNKLDLPQVKYYICSGTSYQPSGLTPSQSGRYHDLLDRMKQYQTTTTTRNQTKYLQTPSNTKKTTVD